MGREIKFRAFHKPTNRVFEVYGLGLDWCTENTLDGVDPGTNAFSGEEFKNDIIIMQFTGLTDKNGKEIYEDDVLDNSQVVSFSAEQACFWCGTVPLCMSNSHREVIGNIHQNPELINKK